MAIYGVDLYAKSLYGVDIPIQFTVQPFVARQLEYGTLHITWTTPRQVTTSTSAGKAWSSLRLVRNFYGFPVTATDGAILLEAPNTAPVESFLDITAPAGGFAYYAIFVLTAHDAYDSSRTYAVGDMVSYSGTNYVALSVTQGQTPGTGSAWSATTSTTEWVPAGGCIGLVIQNWNYSDFLYANTPRAYKVNDIETTSSNPDFNNQLWKFDQIFGFGFDIMKTENDALLGINDIETTRDRFILSMAEQMGIGEELPDEPVLRRLRIMDAVSIAQQKGSIPGLLSLIEDTTGWGATITPGYNMMLDIDQAAWAHPFVPVWDPNTRYQTNEAVLYTGVIYQARLPNAGHVPDPTIIGVPPTLIDQDFWHWFKAKPAGWRGVWDPSATYVSGDSVVWPAASGTIFYLATSLTTTGVAPPTNWFGNGTQLDDRGVTTTFAGVWNSATSYTVNQLVVADTNPGSAGWVAIRASSAINNYWAAAAVPLVDPNAVLQNPTTGGPSTWTGTNQSSTASMAVLIDGIPAAGSAPARNCVRLNNNDSTGRQTTASSVSVTFIATWAAASNYVEGNVVAYSGHNYICILNSPASTTTPNNDPAHWTSYAPGATEPLATQQGIPIPHVRPWDHQRTYNPGDKVTINKNIYQATYSTQGSSPSGYRTDSRGWRWVGPEQALFTSSVYYQRQAPSGSTNIAPFINWYGPQNNLILSLSPLVYPQLMDRFLVDGPIGGTAPGSYPVVPSYAPPIPIPWIDAGGPWRVDNGICHTVYPATHYSGQFLVMSENIYGTSLVPGTDVLSLWVTFVSAPQDPNREQGLIFNLDTTARTYWMMSRTRLTKNTYAADFSSTVITQVGSAWSPIPDGSRVLLYKQAANLYTGYLLVSSTTNTQLFAPLSDAFSTTGTLHGMGERPKS